MIAEVMSMILATYAASHAQLQNAVILAESVREFGGQYRDAPIWVYVPHDLAVDDTALFQELGSLDVEMRTSRLPEDAGWFYYAGKVFAARDAEIAAEELGAILVWMDDDTIVLREPTHLNVSGGYAFAYRPVMHNRSGSLFSACPDPFWSRVYQRLKIADSAIFPMTTVADRQEIRAYFNAGLLVVRPERGLLRLWSESFQTLYRDTMLVRLCHEEVRWRIFLHQAALCGILNVLSRDEIVELTDSYNYPLFFEKEYAASESFRSLAEVTTLRFEVYRNHPHPEWIQEIEGSAEKKEWLARHLAVIKNE